MLIFLKLPSYSQTHAIDSLEKVLPFLKDSARIDCLNALSKEHSFYGLDTATIFANSALKEAENISYIKGIGEAYNNLAWTKWLLGDDYPKMEMYCNKAIGLLQKAKANEQLAYAWFLSGCAHWMQGKFSLSIDAYKKAGRAYPTITGEPSLAVMYAYIASVEEARGQYGKSLEYSVKWLDIAKKHNSTRYFDIWAALYRNVGDYTTALDYYRQAARYARQSQHMDELAYFTQAMGEVFFLQAKYDSAGYYYNVAMNYKTGGLNLDARVGELHVALKKHDTALVYLNDALSDAKIANGRVREMWILLRLSKAYKEIKNNKEALQISRELLQTAGETGARQYIRDAHFLLYQLFEQSGKQDSAFSHLQKYTGIKDSIDQDISAQKLSFYKIRYEKEKDQVRIDLLNEEKKLQQQKLKQTALQKQFLIFGIAAILLIGIVLIRNISLKQKNEKQLVQHTLKLQQLESKVESQQALLNERLRISRELHDDIGSTLGSISIYSEVAKKRTEKHENTNEVLSKIGLASRELIDKMSDIVWSLNPNNESFEQLQHRMMAFAAMILAPRNILYDFTTDEGLKTIQFTGEQRKNIFLIFKEALYNMVKYAECKTAVITLSVQKNEFIMVIHDDGKGFDTSPVTSNGTPSAGEYLGGNGIKNMNARADDMKAKLCISSKINEGTTVQFTLPLSKSLAENTTTFGN